MSESIQRRTRRTRLHRAGRRRPARQRPPARTRARPACADRDRRQRRPLVSGARAGCPAWKVGGGVRGARRRAGEESRPLRPVDERAGRPGRQPRRDRDRPGRRRGRRPGRLRGGLLDARRALRAIADHLAGDGRFLGRRQDRRGPAERKEPGRRLPPAVGGACRHPDTCHPARSRIARRPGRGGEVRRDRRRRFLRLARNTRGRAARPRPGGSRACDSGELPAQGRRSWRATRPSRANACCSTSATPSAMRSRPSRATAGCCTAKRWRSAWCSPRGCRPGLDARRTRMRFDFRRC